ARAGRPGFLAIDCYRFYGHARKDKSPYRDAAEEEAGRARDPVAFSRARLLERGLVTEAVLDALDAEIGADMDGTIGFTIAAGRARDPVAFSRARLLERGLVTEAVLDALDAEIGAEMDATIDFTIAADEPPLASMFRDVFAPGEPEPEPVRARIDRVLARD